MTLYYTKMGISYVTDTMKKADTEILKQEQESFERFIKDAKYKQLESGTAINDMAAYDAVLNAQKSKASIVMSDKGICPKGCFGCDTGGTYVNDDIDKCQKISKDVDNDTSNKAQLVPVGTVQDVGFLLESEADEMYQLQSICNGAELFPETDASKALLKRSQIIDLTLMFNQKQPVMFSLSEDEQLLAGNQFMRLLIQRAGSLKKAIPYAIGRKKLEEIGIYNEFTEELKGIECASHNALLTDNSVS